MRAANSIRAKRTRQGILDAALRQFACAAGKESVMGFLMVCVMDVVLALPTANAAELTNHSAATAVSAEPRQWSLSLRWENDTFGGTDRFYTDGVSLGVSHTGPSWMDPVANWLPWGQGRRTVGYDVAQAMVTPSGYNTSRSRPD